MAATVPSNPYDVFIRKIGWSVGLENTFERVSDLVQLYVSQKDITPASWERLVHDQEAGWGLKGEHIGDFFASIQLVREQRNEVQILPCLDALALASVELGADLFPGALRFTLGSQLLLSDGDILLNFMAGGFQRVSVERLLREMIVAKRRKVLEVVRAPQLMEKVVRAISIDVQATNIGGAGVGRSLSERKRLAPLKPRTESLASKPDPSKVEISDDYFRKVTGRRRDWTRSLGLLQDEDQLNDTGEGFLKAFRGLTGSPPTGAITYWPMGFELERLHVRPDELGIPEISLWAHVEALFRGLSHNPSLRPPTGRSAQAEILAMLRRMYEVYRDLCPRRSLLRREIPIFTFLHAVASCYSARGLLLPSLQKIIEGLAGDPSNDVMYRRSRHFEATVAVKR